MPVRDKTLVHLGLRIRQFREAADMTQEAFASQCNLDLSYISGIERGLRNPSIITLRQLAKGLGIKLSKLVEGLEA